MTDEEKDIEQLNCLHIILSSFINDDYDAFKVACNKVSKLHGYKNPLQVAFEVAKTLDKSYRELTNHE